MSQTEPSLPDRPEAPPAPGEPPRWLQPDGEPIACLEKLKVLRENLLEIHQTCQDALEDAILMGCDEAQFRDVLRALVDSLDNPYDEKA